MREDNEIFSFSFGRVSRSDSEPPIGTVIIIENNGFLSAWENAFKMVVRMNGLFFLT